MQPQGETLAYKLDGEGILVGSEGVGQPIYAIGFPATATDDTAAPTPSSDDSSGTRWALGLAAILLVSGVAALIMRKRGRVRQPSSPIT